MLVSYIFVIAVIASLDVRTDHGFFFVVLNEKNGIESCEGLKYEF